MLHSHSNTRFIFLLHYRQLHSKIKLKSIVLTITIIVCFHA
nr:MAG TPA: hypothetical protein [Caudoviricetes sp.]